MQLLSSRITICFSHNSSCCSAISPRFRPDSLSSWDFRRLCSSLPRRASLHRYRAGGLTMTPRFLLITATIAMTAVFVVATQSTKPLAVRPARPRWSGWAIPPRIHFRHPPCPAPGGRLWLRTVAGLRDAEELLDCLRGSGVQGAGLVALGKTNLRFAGGKNEWLRLRRAAGSIPAVFVSRSLPQCHHAIAPPPGNVSREPSGHTTANSSNRAGRSWPGARLPARPREPLRRTHHPHAHYPAGPDRDHRAHGIPIESGVHGRTATRLRDWLRRCGRAGLARRWRSRAGRAAPSPSTSPHASPRATVKWPQSGLLCDTSRNMSRCGEDLFRS